MSELTKVRALSAGKLSGNLAGSPHEQNSMTENSETLEKGHFPSKKQKGELHVGNFWEEAKQTPSSDTAVFHVHSRQHANNSCINSPVLQTSHTKHCMLARDDKNFAEESTPLSASVISELWGYSCKYSQIRKTLQGNDVQALLFLIWTKHLLMATTVHRPLVQVTLWLRD